MTRLPVDVLAAVCLAFVAMVVVDLWRRGDAQLAAAVASAAWIVLVIAALTGIIGY